MKGSDAFQRGPTMHTKGRLCNTFWATHCWIYVDIFIQILIPKKSSNVVCVQNVLLKCVYFMLFKKLMLPRKRPWIIIDGRWLTLILCPKPPCGRDNDLGHCVQGIVIKQNGVEKNYNDAIMSAMASQIAGVLIVYSTVCSGADQRKHQSSAALAFVRWIPLTKGQ